MTNSSGFRGKKGNARLSHKWMELDSLDYNLETDFLNLLLYVDGILIYDEL